MGITLLSLRQSERAEPQIKAALLGTDMSKLSARERLALREGKPAALTPRQYVQRLNSRGRELEREQMQWALGRVEQKEIDAMLLHLAKMRGRYATLVVEYAQTDRQIRTSAIAELKDLREQIEELDRGLDMLKEAILDGIAEVAGVKIEKA